MFACIYLKPLDKTAKKKNPQRCVGGANPWRLPYLRTQVLFVLADRGICWRPGGHTTGWISHRMSWTTSFPPSFFPLNCNLQPVLPLYYAFSPIWDDAFIVRSVRLDRCICLRRPFRLYRSEVTHCFPSLPPQRNNRKKKWWGEMFTEWMFAWRTLLAPPS